MNDKALDLMAQLVGANVSNLAAVTDRLEEGLRDQIRALAETVVAIDEVLDRATVIDRATEYQLRMLAPRIDAAYRTLEWMESDG